MKKTGSITMSDIARKLGVSRTAVSFVLNGHAREKGISREMEKSIVETAEAMNYRPSLIAKSLVTQKSMTIGLILPNISITYGPTMAETIEVSALHEGYQVLLCHHGGSEERLNDILQIMLSRRVDGLIVVPTIEIKRSNTLEDLIHSDLPLVFVERDPDDERANFVSVDFQLTVQMGIDYLVEAGHRRIGFLNSHPSLVASRIREQAYKEILAGRHIALDAGLICPAALTTGDVESTGQFLRDIVIDASEPATALVVVGGQRAISCFLALEERGYHVPEDVSIVAITGYQFSPFDKLIFTRVELPYKAIGENALRLLLKEIRSEEKLPKQRVMLKPKFIPGQSTRSLKS